MKLYQKIFVLFASSLMLGCTAFESIGTGSASDSSLSTDTAVQITITSQTRINNLLNVATVATGRVANLSVSASSNGTISAQWQKSENRNNEYDDITQSAMSFSISDINSNHAGYYRARITATIGAETQIIYSNPVELRVGQTGTAPDPAPNVNSFNTSEFNSPFAIVYVQVPRYNQLVDLSSVEYTVNGNLVKGLPQTKHIDNMGSLPETSFRLDGMNGPGQLIYRNREGQEKVLFDCMNKTPACLPMDPAVSFDGRRVIFSVLEGTLTQVGSNGVRLPIKVMSNTTQARLHIADIASGVVTALPHTAGTFDTGPVFLQDGKIMFTSTRAKEYRSGNYFFTPSDEHVLQLWTANGDGTGAARVGPNDRDGSLHPYVLSTGRVVFSTWQLSGMHPNFKNNGVIGNPGTRDNLFWLASVDHTGGQWNAVYGAHGHSFRHDGENDFTKANHFVGETPNGWICTTTYYRKNNLGGGQIICMFDEGPGIEGRGPAETKQVKYMFTPRSIVPVTKWATSGDFISNVHPVTGQFYGKVRDPSGLPGNQMLLTHLKGMCSTSRGLTDIILNQDANYGCDGGIYKTTKVPSLDPSDLVPIVDKPDWHEFMARVAEPYSFVFGKPRPDMPAVPRDAEGKCLIRVSQMKGEVEHVKPYAFNDSEPCAKQGCKMAHAPMEDVKALRFWQVMPNTDRAEQMGRIRSNIGNRLKLMGDVKLLGDGSTVAEIPCDTPYVMAGVDGDGHTILRDQVTQSLRPGEIRTCTGCHLHSEAGKPFELSLAASFTGVTVLGKGNVPIIQNGAIRNVASQPIFYEFKRDVYPILQNRCASCHSGASAAKGLRLDIPGASYLTTPMENTSTWFRITQDFKQQLVPEAFKFPTRLEKPNASLYMSMVFSRESLFYWKTVNRRTDGRTDAQYSNDIDFGPAHPTSVTPLEAEIIRDWIDTGAYAAPD